MLKALNLNIETGEKVKVNDILKIHTYTLIPSFYIMFFLISFVLYNYDRETSLSRTNISLRRYILTF